MGAEAGQRRGAMLTGDRGGGENPGVTLHHDAKRTRPPGRRLAETEEGLAAQELQVLERERAALKRERAYIGQRLALADTARSCGERATRLHQRALDAGEHGRSISRITLPRGDRFSEDEPRDYYELEVVPDMRAGAARSRETAVRARLETLTARLHTIEREEKALEYRTELYRLREQELDRLESQLGDIEQGVPPEVAAELGEEESATATEATPGRGDREGRPGGGSRARSDSVIPTGPSAKDSGADRREQARFGLKVYVGVESEHNFYTGFSRNISTGGLFIASHEPLCIGQEVELLFTMPSGDVVHTPGRVAWVRDFNPDNPGSFPGMGVRFVDLTPDDAEKIRYFLEEREPLVYQD